MICFFTPESTAHNYRPMASNCFFSRFHIPLAISENKRIALSFSQVGRLPSVTLTSPFLGSPPGFDSHPGSNYPPLQAPDIQELTLRVMDSETLADAEFIGMAKIPLRQNNPGEVIDKWVDLVPESLIEQRRAGEKHVHER